MLQRGGGFERLLLMLAGALFERRREEVRRAGAKLL